MSKVELLQYSRTDLENARTKGQVIGWIQGAGALLVGSFVLHALGWLPTLLVAGVLGFIAYKVMKR
jgi:hypothetical protein